MLFEHARSYVVVPGQPLAEEHGLGEPFCAAAERAVGGVVVIVFDDQHLLVRLDHRHAATAGSGPGCFARVCHTGVGPDALV